MRPPLPKEFAQPQTPVLAVGSGLRVPQTSSFDVKPKLAHAQDALNATEYENGALQESMGASLAVQLSALTA